MLDPGSAVLVCPVYGPAHHIGGEIVAVARILISAVGDEAEMECPHDVPGLDGVVHRRHVERHQTVVQIYHHLMRFRRS